MSRGKTRGYTLYVSLWWKLLLLLILGLGMLKSDGVQQVQRAPYPTLKWVYTLPKLDWAGFSFVSGDPALSPDGTVYITWICLLALDPQGRLKWQTSESGIGNCLWDITPVVDPKGDVYGEGGGRMPLIYGIDSNGLVKWTWEAGSFASLLAFNQGTIYALTDVLIAISAQDGSLRWKSLTLRDYLQDLKEPFEVSGPTPPVILSDGKILVLALMIQGTRSEGFKPSLLRYIFHPNGSLKSVVRIPIEQPDRTIHGLPFYESGPDGIRTFSPVIGADGTLYAVVNEGYRDSEFPRYGITLYAIDSEGKILWSWARRGEGLRTEPVLGVDGTIYLGLDSMEANTLHAISPDGETKWSFPLPDRYEIISGAPAVGADGVIYLPTAISAQWCIPPVKAYGGKIYALSSEGELLWTFETIGDIRSSPTLAPDGTLYFTTVGPCQQDDTRGEINCEGRVYALQTGSPGLADSPWPMFRHDPQHSGRLSTP